MKNLPKKLYLQIGEYGEKEVPKSLDWNSLTDDEITWCNDNVYGGDIEMLTINPTEKHIHIAIGNGQFRLHISDMEEGHVVQMACEFTESAPEMAHLFADAILFMLFRNDKTRQKAETLIINKYRKFDPLMTNR